jgi:transmembrane sensor
MPALSHQALQQAAEWFALLRSGEATAADRAQ